jgi:signal peptidase II
LIASVAVVLDILSKHLTVKYLKPIGTFKIIEGVFQLSYRQNTGAAFSMLEGQQLFFIITTGILLLVIAYLLITNVVQSFPAACALACVFGGGIGNLIDRVNTGYVVDMFDFCLINFAVFNVADIFITCGSILFILIYIFYKGDMLKWK